MLRNTSGSVWRSWMWVVGLCSVVTSSLSAATVSRLRCESLESPMGIVASNPHLSWAMDSAMRGDRQSAYEVRVATSLEMLGRGEADLWESGEVQSDACLNVAYSGKPLSSGQRCFWQVRIRDAQGAWSPWSVPANWTMGLIDEANWSGSWIAAEAGSAQPERKFFRRGDQSEAEAWTLKEAPAIYMRREATLARTPVRATAFVCGLGYFELYLNGKRVGDHVMDPIFTDYAHRELYVTFDVTSLLQAGPNAIGVILGNGFYNLPTPDLFQLEKADWRTPPRLRLDIAIEYADGSEAHLASDSEWMWRTGPIRFNCIRGGETIDSRIKLGAWLEPGFAPSAAWSPVVVVAPSRARLSPQLAPPMRVVRTLAPVAVTEPSPGVWIVDFGRNLTGWVRMTAQGRSGQVVNLDYNEALKDDGNLDLEHSSGHTYGRFQHGEFVLSGGSEPDVFEPRFTYHGFRYVQITGLEGSRLRPEQIQACQVNTDLASTGDFACSNARLNQLHAAVRRTLVDCVHGMPAEEPTREKMGWTQDAQNTMESYLYNFDAEAIFQNYVRDMIDSQEANGHVPPVVPIQGWGYLDDKGTPYRYDDPWWGATLAIVVDNLYTWFGDERTLAEAYEPMRRYVDWLATTADHDIVSWSLGDWLELHFDGDRITPVPVTSTACYFYLSELLARHATILGKTEDASHYEQRAAEIRDAFNAKFLSPDGWYAPHSQTAQALALFVGIVPEDRRTQVRANLLADFEQRDRHLTTGFVGAMPTLYELSHDATLELAYAAVTQEEGSGWLFALKGSNETLGENLHPRGYGTRHHPFAACVGAWFFNTLAGIQPDPSVPGFERFIVRPGVVKDLTWVKAHYDSVRGRIAVSWSREDGRFFLDVTVPPNTSATVYLPARSAESVTEAGHPIEDIDGVRFLRQEDGAVILAVSAGQYHLAAPDPLL